MNQFKYSSLNLSNLRQNAKHNFAMRHSMMLYKSNSLYSFIPKNGCSTLRLSVAINNGCIADIENGHWIHVNNETFNATLGEAVRADYTFVILRCPFRRLASVFLDKFISKEPPAWAYRDKLERKIELDDLTFREFINSLKKGNLISSNIHWRRQEDFLIYKDYSDYFSLETFDNVVKSLKEKIGLDIIDARTLTNHGTDRYKIMDDKCYADIAAFDIAIMKRANKCPSHELMYDNDLIQTVTELYKADIKLYKEKISTTNLLFK